MSVVRALAVIGFSLAFVVAIGLEWAARRTASRIPTLGALCGFVMRYRVGRVPAGRILVFAFWWWLGWHFLAR
jgi:hypothetical protein